MSTSAITNSPSPELRPVPVSSIQKAPRADNGFSIDPSKVSALEERMRNGIALPPVKVWWDGATYWLSDGLHRLAAAECAGMSEILCEVRAGSFGDAQWDSYGAISQAVVCLGLGKIRLLLARVFECSTAFTDDEIASHLGVAVSFIRHWRRRILSQGSDSPEDDSDGMVRKATRYVSASLASVPDIPDLARAIGVSVAQLSRRFRRAGWPGPKMLITELRMQRARELLRGGRLSIKEVSSRIGYGRPDQLSRTFARIYGLAPERYREAQPGHQC